MGTNIYVLKNAKKQLICISAVSMHTNLSQK